MARWWQRTWGTDTINKASYVTVGDPYIKPRPKNHGEIKGRGQMTTTTVRVSPRTDFAPVQPPAGCLGRDWLS